MKSIDPVAPPIVDSILNLLKIVPIYSRFCSDVERMMESGGDQSFAVHQKEEMDDGTVKNLFWMPQHIIEVLRKKENLARGTVSKLIKPIVYYQTPSLKKVGKQVQKFWVLDFDKMYRFNSSISAVFDTDHILDCRDDEQ